MVLGTVMGMYDQFKRSYSTFIPVGIEIPTSHFYDNVPSHKNHYNLKDGIALIAYVNSSSINTVVLYDCNNDTIITITESVMSSFSMSNCNMIPVKNENRHLLVNNNIILDVAHTPDISGYVSIWETMPTTCTKPSLFHLNDSIFCIGFNKNCVMINPSTKTVTLLPICPLDYIFASCQMSDGRIMCVGQQTYSIYNSFLNSWSSVITYTAATVSSGIRMINVNYNTVLLYMNTNSDKKRIDLYNPITDTWSVSSHPLLMNHIISEWVKLDSGKILIFGNFTTSSDSYADIIDMSDLSVTSLFMNSFTEQTLMWKCADGTIYFIGGVVSGNNVFKYV